MYILLDRALLFYHWIINWAHGRRDYSSRSEAGHVELEKQEMTVGWSRAEQRICEQFFQAVTTNDEAALLSRTGEMRRLLLKKLALLSAKERS